MRKGFFAICILAVCSVLAAQQTMNNDSVVKLVKAGLSDDLIVSTINGSPGTYDTTANGIIALKTAGASDKVIAAVIAKAAGPATTTAVAAPGVASGSPHAATDQPRLFIKADPNFAVALSAAFTKKRVPVTLVTDERNADYILQSASVNAKQESAGSKFTRCLFADCIGIEGTSSVSVSLIKPSDGSVVWGYQVRKSNGGPVGIQSLSEAIAKHLKNDFLKEKE